MTSKTALHLGIGLTSSPNEKQLESDEIELKLAAYLAKGKTIEILSHGATGRSPFGKNRGAMTVAERARESKKRQVEGPMSVEPTTSS